MAGYYRRSMRPLLSCFALGDAPLSPLVWPSDRGAALGRPPKSRGSHTGAEYEALCDAVKLWLLCPFWYVCAMGRPEFCAWQGVLTLVQDG